MLMRVTAWGKTNLSRLGSALRILVEWGFRLQLSGSLEFGWGKDTVLCPPPVGWYLFYPSHSRLAGPDPAGGKGPESVEPF